MSRLRTAMLGLVTSSLVMHASTAAIADRPFEWSGLYVGAQLGGAWTDVNWDGFPFAAHGVVGGGQIGYNWRSGPWVYGIEATYTGGDMQETFSLLGVTLASKVDWTATVAGRLGYAWDRWLAYAKAGYARGEVTASGREPFFGESFSLSADRDGWTTGVGVEYALSDSITMGVEYSLIDFGRERHQGLSSCGCPVAINIGAEVETVSGRLNYKF